MLHKKAEESWTNAHENNLAGLFPLHHACRDGNSQELRRLLTELQNNVSNAEILIAEDPYYNWTAGHFAAYFGNLDCLRLLMQAGSVYNSSRASSGLSRLPCPLAVLSSRCRQSLLQVAAFANHPQCVQWLLQAAQGLDSQDVNGETALHKACRSGSWECAQLLVACLANPSVRNDNGLAPAQLAESCGHGRLADQLGGLGGDTKTLNGVTNCINGHTNATCSTFFTTGTASNSFSTLTPTTSSSTVNHLVSSNGYYGYHQSHTQTPSTSTSSTGSEFPKVYTSSSDMDMDEGVPVASTSSNGFGGVNLLTDASVSQDLVPVAGKKRVREDELLQQSKRGRFQDAPWSGAEASAGSDTLRSPQNREWTWLSTHSTASPLDPNHGPSTVQASNSHSLFAGSHVSAAASVLLQLGATFPRADKVASAGAKTQELVTLPKNCEMQENCLGVGGSTTYLTDQGPSSHELRDDGGRRSLLEPCSASTDVTDRLFGVPGQRDGVSNRLHAPRSGGAGLLVPPPPRARNGRLDSSGSSSSSDSQDSGIASSCTSMVEEALQASMDVVESIAESNDRDSSCLGVRNLFPEEDYGHCISGASGLSGCPIPAPVDLLARQPADTVCAASLPHIFRPGHLF